MVVSKAKNKVEFQFSAGGIIVDGDKVLLIKTENLQGDEVWAFPKGHIEKKETSENTAVREVLEETGYTCEIIRLIDKVKYWFRDGGKLIKKTVKWFLMKPVSKVSEHDSEILNIKWFKVDEAKGILSYKSDKELLEKI